MIHLHDEGVVQHLHDRLLVLNDVFFLVIADEAFEHDFHGVELAVSETADQVDLAEASNGEAFADLVAFEFAFGHVL